MPYKRLNNRSGNTDETPCARWRVRGWLRTMHLLVDQMPWPRMGQKHVQGGFQRNCRHGTRLRGPRCASKLCYWTPAVSCKVSNSGQELQSTPLPARDAGLFCTVYTLCRMNAWAQYLDLNMQQASCCNRGAPQRSSTLPGVSNLLTRGHHFLHSAWQHISACTRANENDQGLWLQGRGYALHTAEPESITCIALTCSVAYV